MDGRPNRRNKAAFSNFSDVVVNTVMYGSLHLQSCIGTDPNEVYMGKTKKIYNGNRTE